MLISVVGIVYQPQWLLGSFIKHPFLLADPLSLIHTLMFIPQEFLVYLPSKNNPTKQLLIDHTTINDCYIEPLQMVPSLLLSTIIEYCCLFPWLLMIYQPLLLINHRLHYHFLLVNSQYEWLILWYCQWLIHNTNDIVVSYKINGGFYKIHHDCWLIIQPLLCWLHRGARPCSTQVDSSQRVPCTGALASPARSAMAGLRDAPGMHGETKCNSFSV